MIATADHLNLSHENLRRLLGHADEAGWAKVAWLRCQPYSHDRWLYLCLDLTRVAKRAGIEVVPTPARLLALVDRQAVVNRRGHAAWLR